VCPTFSFFFFLFFSFSFFFFINFFHFGHSATIKQDHYLSPWSKTQMPIPISSSSQFYQCRISPRAGLWCQPSEPTCRTKAPILQLPRNINKTKTSPYIPKLILQFPTQLPSSRAFSAKADIQNKRNIRTLSRRPEPFFPSYRSK